MVRGDYTPYWEDGCASTSEATSLCREGCERIIQAQALYAMLQPGAFPAEAFDRAWTDLIMYDEHTWGAYCSISRPDDPFTIHQDEYKQAYARRGRQAADDLVEGAVNQPDRSKPAAAVDVFNTASWERGGVVSIDLARVAGKVSVHDADRRAGNAQVLSAGKLAFHTGKVPPSGARRFTLGRDAPKSEGTAYADAEKLAIGNGLIDLRIDPESGAIASLRCKGIDAELVKTGDDGNRGLDDYLYILGRSAEENRSRQSGSVVVTAVDRGPLLARLRIESPAPNCRTLVREITVVDGCEEIAIENRMEKLMERKPEGTFFGFPLNVPGGQWRINVPWAVVRPELDQLPAANRNYYCVEPLVRSFERPVWGHVGHTLDANMMQFAPILYTPVSDIRAREEISPGGTLYSWVCNNHWETNYKAGQEGPLKFRYVLRPHAGPCDQAAVQRFARGVHQPLLAFSSSRRPAAPRTRAEARRQRGGRHVFEAGPRRPRPHHSPVQHNRREQQVALQTRKDATSIWLSNPLEEKLSAAPARLALEKYEIVTLRIE